MCTANATRHKLTILFAIMLTSWSISPIFTVEMEDMIERAETTQISLSSESSYLLDLGYMHETVNAMAYAPNGDLVIGGTLCGVYYLPEDPETCQLTVDGVDVTSDVFAPAYLLTLDSSGSAKESRSYPRAEETGLTQFPLPTMETCSLVAVHVGFNQRTAR